VPAGNLCGCQPALTGGDNGDNNPAAVGDGKKPNSVLTDTRVVVNAPATE